MSRWDRGDESIMRVSNVVTKEATVSKVFKALGGDAGYGAKCLTFGGSEMRTQVENLGL
jgi:hypothetical protein